MSYWHGKRALVIGGSSGLGRALGAELVAAGARVALVARGQEGLTRVAEQLSAGGAHVLPIAADVTRDEDVRRVQTAIASAWNGVDAVFHCAGRSMRGTILETRPEEFRELWELNFLSALRCAQAFGGALAASQGHLVLVGSLASKTAAGYLGAYPASKFSLAALAQQLRMEDCGFHVLLVCPGPIARDDAPGLRYAEQANDIPANAHKPGGGAKLSAIDPRLLARRMLQACESRRLELVVPAKSRVLFIVSQISARWGDWLLRMFSS